MIMLDACNLAQVAQYRAKKADESMVPSQVLEKTSLAPLWLAQAWVFVFVRTNVATLNSVAIANTGTKKTWVALRLTRRREYNISVRSQDSAQMFVLSDNNEEIG